MWPPCPLFPMRRNAASTTRRVGRYFACASFLFNFYFVFHFIILYCHTYCAVLVTILVLLLNKFDLNLIWYKSVCCTTLIWLSTVAYVWVISRPTDRSSDGRTDRPISYKIYTSALRQPCNPRTQDVKCYKSSICQQIVVVDCIISWRQHTAAETEQREEDEDIYTGKTWCLPAEFTEFTLLTYYLWWA